MQGGMMQQGLRCLHKWVKRFIFRTSCNLVVDHARDEGPLEPRKEVTPFRGLHV